MTIAELHVLASRARDRAAELRERPLVYRSVLTPTGETVRLGPIEPR